MVLKKNFKNKILILIGLQPCLAGTRRNPRSRPAFTRGDRKSDRADKDVKGNGKYLSAT